MREGRFDEILYEYLKNIRGISRDARNRLLGFELSAVNKPRFVVFVIAEYSLTIKQ